MLIDGLMMIDELHEECCKILEQHGKWNMRLFINDKFCKFVN